MAPEVNVELCLDCVVVEGVTIRRPARISRSQWEDVWKLITMYQEIVSVEWANSR